MRVFKLYHTQYANKIGINLCFFFFLKKYSAAGFLLFSFCLMKLGVEARKRNEIPQILGSSKDERRRGVEGNKIEVSNHCEVRGK